jgi:hypothetical protein
MGKFITKQSGNIDMRVCEFSGKSLTFRRALKYVIILLLSLLFIILKTGLISDKTGKRIVFVMS